MSWPFTCLCFPNCFEPEKIVRAGRLFQEIAVGGWTGIRFGVGFGSVQGAFQCFGSRGALWAGPAGGDRIAGIISVPGTQRLPVSDNLWSNCLEGIILIFWEVLCTSRVLTPASLHRAQCILQQLMTPFIAIALLWSWLVPPSGVRTKSM